MNLHKAQKEIAADPHRFRVVDAGRRFGKDILGIEEAIGAGLAIPGARIPYIGTTLQQTRDIVWEPLKKRLKPILIDLNETRMEAIFKSTGDEPSKIVLKGWENIETERGNKNAFIVSTETAMKRNFWVGWQEVLRPTLTDLEGGALFLSTPKGYNHFYDLFEMQKRDPANWKSFHYTTFDNPHINPQEIEEARKTMTEDRFAQEYLAEFRKMEGLVYKEFSRFEHVFDDATPRRAIAEVIAGVDFGFTNPSAILRIEHDVDNHYWITREWYQTNRTTAELISVARTMGINIFYPDPAEPDRIQEMERAGLNCREVSKDIEAGIQSVRELFRQGRLHIHRDCINLISELESYRYPDKKPDQNEKEVPVKEKDHACDALRYALHQNAPAEESEQPEFNLYSESFS
jgi:PBSX family phage terminase large subunit